MPIVATSRISLSAPQFQFDMEAPLRELWSWQHSFAVGKDEKQFLIVSLARGEVLVGTEKGCAQNNSEVRTVLPAVLSDRGGDSYVNYVHQVLEGKYSVWPVAVLWSDCRETIVDNVHLELKKEVILINWFGSDSMAICSPHKWVSIYTNLNIYHHFFEARFIIEEELEFIRTSKIPRPGLPWNSFEWIAQAMSIVNETLECSLSSVIDLRFSPRGVVLRATTTKGVYFLKACHPLSSEPSTVAITSKSMTSVCDDAFYVDETQKLIISKDHGPSIVTFMDSELEHNAACSLAIAQISSIGLVSKFLSHGVLDATPSNFVRLVRTIGNHSEFEWIEKQQNLSFQAVRKLRILMPTLEAEVAKRAKLLDSFPPVLLHNDLGSGNVFRSDNEELKLFDFGFAAIGHPFMDFSFRLLSHDARKFFCNVWKEQGYNCSNSSDMIRHLSLPAYVVRLSAVLDSLVGGRVSEKLILAPLVDDICDMISMFLPGGDANIDSLSSGYRGATIVRYSCRTCGEALEESTVGSLSAKVFRRLKRHVHTHYPQADVSSDLELYFKRSIVKD